MDISLISSNDSFDIEYDENGDFKTDSLETSIYMALFCDDRADISEVSRSEFRRGFFGNVFGKEYGSKMWLNNGLKTRDNLNRLIDYAKKSLNFLVENETLKDIAVDGGFIDNGVYINITITYFNDNRKEIRIEV